MLGLKLNHVNKRGYWSPCIVCVISLNHHSVVERNFDQRMDSMHYNDVIMTKMASQMTSLTIVYSTVYSDQRKHQSSASLAFVRKMFPFDDVIMVIVCWIHSVALLLMTSFCVTGLLWSKCSEDSPHKGSTNRRLDVSFAVRLLIRQ